jgi:hypothetical protein
MIPAVWTSVLELLDVDCNVVPTNMSSTPNITAAKPIKIREL